MKSRLLCVSFFVGLGCQLGATTPPPEPTDEAATQDATPLEPETPTNKTEGEQLDAAIPLYGGGVLQLAELRGRVVLIELSASSEPSWQDSLSFFDRMHERFGDALAVVVIVNDERGDALETVAVGRSRWSWDPQGAMAARLRVAGFPTLLVVDREGHIGMIERGFDDQIAIKVEAEIARLVSAS